MYPLKILNVINQHGYIKAGGNHALAVIGRRMYPYPRKSPVNHNYIKGLLEIIDSEAE
jgi:hypothetical protein